MHTSQFTLEDGTEVEFEWDYTRGDGPYYGFFTHYVEEDRIERFEDDDVPPDWMRKAEDIVFHSLMEARREGYRV